MRLETAGRIPGVAFFSVSERRCHLIQKWKIVFRWSKIIGGKGGGDGTDTGKWIGTVLRVCACN